MGHVSFTEKECDEFKLHKIKQSDQDDLIERAVKATILILSDRAFFDNCDNADEVLKDYLLTEVNERRIPDLDPNKK